MSTVEQTQEMRIPRWSGLVWKRFQLLPIYSATAVHQKNLFRGLSKRPATSSGQVGAVVDEPLIERYVRCPESLSENVRRMVEAHLRELPEAQQLADFYRDFYQELDALADVSSPQLEAFIASLFPTSAVVPLFQHSPRTNLEGLGDDLITVLASREPDVVVSVMHDGTQDGGLVKVLTTDPNRRAYAVISFTELSLPVMVGAGGLGHFDFPPSASDDDFRTALLHFPVAEVNLGLDDVGKEGMIRVEKTYPIRDAQYLQVALWDGELQMSITPQRGGVSYIRSATVRSAAKEPTYTTFHEGHASVQFSSASTSLSIRLYE